MFAFDENDTDISKFYITSLREMSRHRDIQLAKNGIHVIHRVGRREGWKFRGAMDFFPGLELCVYGRLGENAHILYEVGVFNNKLGRFIVAEVWESRPRIFARGGVDLEDNYVYMHVSRYPPTWIYLKPWNYFCYRIRAELYTFGYEIFWTYYYDQPFLSDYVYHKEVTANEVLYPNSHTMHSIHLIDSWNRRFHVDGIDKSYLDEFVHMDPGSFAVYTGHYRGPDPIRIKTEGSVQVNDLGKPDDKTVVDVKVIVKKIVDAFVFSTNYGNNVVVAKESDLSPSGVYTPHFESNLTVYHVLLET